MPLSSEIIFKIFWNGDSGDSADGPAGSVVVVLLLTAVLAISVVEGGVLTDLTGVEALAVFGGDFVCEPEPTSSPLAIAGACCLASNWRIRLSTSRGTP